MEEGNGVQWWGLGDGESPRLVSGFYGPVSGCERRVKTESVARNTLRRLDEEPEAGRGFIRSMVISAFVQRWLSYHPWMDGELTMVEDRSRVKRGCVGGARQGGVVWPGSALHSWGAYDGLPNNELAEASGNRRLPTVSVAVQGPSSEQKNK
jgi:hypothetical protein